MGLFSKIGGKHPKGHPFCSALVPAAGTSSRMEGQDKLLLYLGGCPVLARTLLALDGCELIDEIIVATRQESILKIADLCKEYHIQKPLKIIEGGATRAESVYLAALNASEQAAYFAVHDGARPLVEQEQIISVIRKAYQCAAAAPATPVKDTIKVVAEDLSVDSTPQRSTLYAVQTPQVFDASLLKAALQLSVDERAEITDDCGAVERLGKKVYLVQGSYENIKITTPIDLAIGEKILELRGGVL